VQVLSKHMDIFSKQITASEKISSPPKLEGYLHIFFQHISATYSVYTLSVYLYIIILNQSPRYVYS